MVHARTFRQVLAHNTAIFRNVRAPKNVKFIETSVVFVSDPVNVRVYETIFGYYVKPVDMHFKYQFENFFGFGCGNVGFDKERTTYVLK